MKILGEDLWFFIHKKMKIKNRSLTNSTMELIYT